MWHEGIQGENEVGNVSQLIGRSLIPRGWMLMSGFIPEKIPQGFYSSQIPQDLFLTDPSGFIPRLLELQECLDRMGLLGYPGRARARLNDPYGSLPAWNSMIFSWIIAIICPQSRCPCKAVEFPSRES